MCKSVLWVSGLSLFLMHSLVRAESTACMVIGERTARLSSAEGQRSPVFMTKDCDALRLISGKARASWIGRDGKPKMVPITSAGVESLPQAGAEERSVNLVWNELTTRRERQQPAYMRNFGNERPPKVYVPAEGLVLVERLESDAMLSVDRIEDVKSERVASIKAKAGDTLRVARTALAADQTYSFRIERGESAESWKWKVIGAEQALTFDEELRSINSSVDDPEQQLMIKAMFYEQNKIRSNMDLIVQQLKSRRVE